MVFDVPSVMPPVSGGRVRVGGRVVRPEMMFEIPSLGPGVETSSTRKDQATGMGARRMSPPKEDDDRTPLALTVRSQVVHATTPVFSAEAEPETLKPVISLVVGKGVDAIVFAPKRPKEAAGVGVTDVVFTAKTIAACRVGVPTRRARARSGWVLMLSKVRGEREVDHFL